MEIEMNSGGGGIDGNNNKGKKGGGYSVHYVEQEFDPVG